VSRGDGVDGGSGRRPVRSGHLIVGVGRGGGGRLQHPGRSDVDQGRGHRLAPAAAAPAAVAAEADEDAGRHAHEHHHRDHRRHPPGEVHDHTRPVALVAAHDLVAAAGTRVALALIWVTGVHDAGTAHSNTVRVVRIRPIHDTLTTVSVDERVRDTGVR
jgi:hypothetical protein